MRRWVTPRPRARPRRRSSNAIVDFELALFTAQQTDNAAGVLHAEKGDGGPEVLAAAPYFPGINDPLGDNPTGAAFNPTASTLFGPWKDLHNSGRWAEPRQAVARGRRSSTPIRLPSAG